MNQPLNIVPLDEWLPKKFDRFIIAGPCGAETREQVLGTAEEISILNKVSLFRAGVWKPRTRPNTFEGVGEPALYWLNEVKKKYNLMTAVEVANSGHVELALKHGIDVLWIGARTTVNPFSVQEIADAVKGHDIPVLVKNPIHADLQLWVGAIERVLNSGVKKIAAIHRGFHSMNRGNLRYDPNWQIPIQLKTFFPSLPIICDPSHIAGERKLIKDIAQRAMDLVMDGLMIETHISPASAWSDAAQQITPVLLGELIQSLQFRSPSSDNLNFKDDLMVLRTEIDQLDAYLFEILEKRNTITNRLGQVKKKNNVSIFQLDRWVEILRTRGEWAKEKKLDAVFIEQLCKLLHEESMRIQNNIMNQSQKE